MRACQISLAPVVTVMAYTVRRTGGFVSDTPSCGSRSATSSTQQSVGTVRSPTAHRWPHPPSRTSRWLTEAEYARQQHVVVSRRGRLHDPIDDILESRGLRRHVVASLSHAGAAFRVVATSDLLVSVPDRVPLPAGLTTRPLPVPVLAAPINLSWHRGATLTVEQRTVNALHSATRALAERGNSLLKTTFKGLRRVTLCPWRIGAITAAALVLLHHEHDRTT